MSHQRPAPTASSCSLPVSWPAMREEAVQSDTSTAQVLALWRYPVKSMQGEQVDQIDVGPSGLAGDRCWALVDRDRGFVLTARREPRLLYARARLIAGADGRDEVEVTLPDGTRTTDDAELSAWLGRPVTFERATPGRRGTYENPADPEDETHTEWLTWQGPPGTFHDSTRTHISIVGAASLGAWDPRRFRPNVIVSGGHEQAWMGRCVRLGTATAEAVKAIDRCVIVTRPQPGGIERDLGVLRTINGELGAVLGIGVLVREPGTLSVGDAVESVPEFPAPGGDATPSGA
jgi:uncharacterized protein